jgi:hypothetical protein
MKVEGRTLEELVRIGWFAIDCEIDSLKETGGIWMKYIVLSEAGAEYIVAGDERLINDAEHKSKMMAMVRERTKATNAFAVLVVSDTWVSESTGGMDIKTLERIEDIGIPEAVAQGLITSREAIICYIATPIHHTRLVQFYRRDGETIIMEERKDHTGEGVKGGRLSRFFEHVKLGAS